MGGPEKPTALHLRVNESTPAGLAGVLVYVPSQQAGGAVSVEFQLGHLDYGVAPAVLHILRARSVGETTARPRAFRSRGSPRNVRY